MHQDLNREIFQGQEIVFSSGDPGDSAYVIEEGCVEVLVGDSDNPRRIALLTEGALFGEVALLDGQPRTAAVRTLSLAQDLSSAVDSDQLELFYQPLIALDGLVMTGYEALIRWRHPRLGLVNPAEFIPLAEKTGLIHRIGQWVLHRAVADWAELRPFCRDDAQHRPYVSINLSAPELASSTIVNSIRDRLKQYRMNPAELRIELTETVIIQNMEAVSHSVQQLRDLGTGIALDDFGTGYAGLDYLQTLPFTCLKIDRSFVQQIHQSDRSVHIIRAALELARSMGLSTIAEGIEDAATGELLASMGCSHAQGFYYARPMSKALIAQWATARQA